MPVKNRIKQLLKEKGIPSIGQVVRDTGLARNTVKRLVNNPETYPDKETLEKILRAYDVTVDQVIVWVPDEAEAT
jgi:transcriptional regulator with XRE-family HTH domain